MRYTNWPNDNVNQPNLSGEAEACIELLYDSPDNSVFNNRWFDRPCSLAICSICEIDM